MSARRPASSRRARSSRTPGTGTAPRRSTARSCRSSQPPATSAPAGTRSYGGSGLDTVSYALLVEELGKADSSVRGIVSVNVGLVGKTIARFGGEEQKREWLPGLASRRAARLLRAHGARLRLRRRRARDARGARRRRLAPDRLEDLHHPRHLGRRRARLREDGRARAARDHRLPRPHRRRRLRGPADQGQARAAGPGHRGALARRRPCPGREPARRARPGASGSR